MNYTPPGDISDIVQNPDWIKIPFDKNYQVSYKVVSNNILHCKADGYCSLKGLKGSLSFSHKIIKKHFGFNNFIYIEDFSGLDDISHDARKYYIKYMKAQDRMIALIFHDVSSIFKLSIKLARWLNIVKFDIRIAANFEDSIKISKNIFKNKGINLYTNSNIQTNNNQLTTENISHKKMPNSGIVYKSDNYDTSYEIINGNILHFQQQGVLKAHDVHPVIQADYKIIKEVLNNHSDYHIIAGIKKIKVTFKARQMYLQETIKLYNTYPFKNYVFYGANWLVRSAINLSSPKAPFPVSIVNDFNDALQLILTRRKKKNIKFFPSFFKKNKSKKISEEQIKQDINDLMGFLGGINWETDGVKNHHLNPPPLLANVYEGIALLKIELDEQNRQRRLAEEQRAKFQKKLEHSMKMEAVGTVAGGVAHDLNNVLGGLISYPEIMLMELPDNSPLREDLKIIHQSGIKAAAIVQDLLTLTRRGIIVSEPVDMNKVINDYLSSPEFNKLKKFHPEVKFKKNLSANLDIIDGSPVHLQKAVMNIVSNCAEAIKEKGQVQITTYNNKQDSPNFNNKLEDDSIVIKITDTGIGISEHELERIFEPFFTKKKMGLSGTGLGMAVVWNTVNDHKGFIDVKSKLNIGTTFSLFFPVSKKKHSLIKKKDTEFNTLIGKGQSVLVADDLPEQREIASMILTKLGYKVNSVPSGEEAVEYILKKPADLLVLDMIMEPGIDGLETYRQILEHYPEQKAIIASGFSEPESLKELFPMKNIRYIKKPYTIMQIGQVIKDIIPCDN